MESFANNLWYPERFSIFHSPQILHHAAWHHSVFKEPKVLYDILNLEKAKNMVEVDLSKNVCVLFNHDANNATKYLNVGLSRSSVVPNLV